MILQRAHNPRFRLGACAALLALACAPLQALQVVQGPVAQQTQTLHWEGFRRFSNRDGLPQNTIYALAQDRAGFIYAGTEDGLARYDGRVWQALPLPAAANGHPFVQRLLAGADGALWIGTDSAGLLRHVDGVITSIALPPDASEHDIEALESADADAVWAGTPRSLYRCTRETCREIVAAHGLQIAVLLAGIGPEGPCLWIGTNNDGIYRLDHPDTAAVLAAWHFVRADGLPNSSVRSLAQWGGAQGRDLWIGTGRGLARLSGEELTVYGAAQGIDEGGVAALLPGRTRDGAAILHVGTAMGGLGTFTDAGTWTLTTRANGLPEDQIRSLLLTDADRVAPVLWIGTQASGIARQESGAWSAFDERHGLPHRVVRGMGEAEFPDGVRTYWVGTIAGPVRWRDGRWEAWLPAPYAAQTVHALRRVGEALWVATSRSLLRVNRDASIQSYNVDNSAIPGMMVLDLSYSDTGPDAGTLWIGTHHGLARMRNDLIKHESVPPLGGDPFVRVFAQTRNVAGADLLWLAGDDGIAYRRDGAWHALPENCLAHSSIMDMREHGAPGAEHALWTAGRDGIVRIDLDHDLRCEPLPASVLPPELIYQMQFDRAGRVYLFGYNGVVRLTPDAQAPHDLARYTSERFGIEDGLPTLEFNRASMVDDDGRVWAGTTEGAVLYDPASETPPVAPRPLQLLGAHVEGGRTLRDGAALDANENSVAFEYALLSYQRDHLTRYRSELVGLPGASGDWSAVAHSAYTRLPAGDYEFRVFARDGFGVESGPATLRFAIRTPWWQRGYMFALYALALIALGLTMGRWRARALARRASMLEREVAARTQALAEANVQLEQASLTDPLTGLRNRRYFDIALPAASERALRRTLAGADDCALVLALLDLDHFKQVNDLYGHAVGDAVLCELASRIGALLRDGDIALRWGGEEFLLVLPDLAPDAAAMLLDRLSHAISDKLFAAGAQPLRITCSIGWAMFPQREDPHAVTPEQVLSLADQALYRAKEAGRNCVRCGAMRAPHASQPA